MIELKVDDPNLLSLVKALPAAETGLVPEGWTAFDAPEGELELSKLYCTTDINLDDFDLYSARGAENVVKRAIEQNVVGSLGFAKIVLDFQEKGIRIVSPKISSKHCILLPRTILFDRAGIARTPYLRWFGKQCHMRYKSRWQRHQTVVAKINK